MLAEGFLRLMCYREKRRFATASQSKGCQTSSGCADQHSGSVSEAKPRIHSAEAEPNQEEPDRNQPQRLRVERHPHGLLIPGCSPAAPLPPICIEDCSLLEHYPDLQVADSGRISHIPPRTVANQEDSNFQSDDPEMYLSTEIQQESIPDQGYLVMGAGKNISLDLPGSGLEPMSNSVLNGLLEKQLEEVYMQHLTDNLARCNSHFGHSLLHGLVPPPQPGSQLNGSDSLEASLAEGCGVEGTDRISYLSTNNVAPCSSTFSSPVLRISEVENHQLSGNILPK
ncbi:uncharacterized protein si:dkey-237j10.2 [Cyprinodon tularosa]|uniref:uncharacterized protein si:dkey-237j10.2 n=1 Tax=Cyprinodon tularosa TaxID=77115 RepID=UPI0018E22CA4|nr:uncharacterized protein si:dkey-237j10.2 [Cyprinodon tularosa]